MREDIYIRMLIRVRGIGGAVWTAGGSVCICMYKIANITIECTFQGLILIISFRCFMFIMFIFLTGETAKTRCVLQF